MAATPSFEIRRDEGEQYFSQSYYGDGEGLETFLLTYQPSRMVRETAGVSWLRVFLCHPGEPRTVKHTDGEKDQLRAEFERERETLRGNDSRMKDVAVRHHITDGKWYWFIHKALVDKRWARIARDVINGRVKSSEAAVTVLSSSGEHKDNLIAVYSENFRDEEEVFRLKDSIRALGVRQDMFYKPRFYTMLDNVRSFGLRPQMYIDKLG